MISPLLEADVRAKCKVLGGPTAYEPFFEKLGVVFSNGQLLSECKPSWTEAMRELAGTPAPLPYLTDEEARSYACGQQARARRGRIVARGSPAEVGSFTPCALGEDTLRIQHVGVAREPFLALLVRLLASRRRRRRVCVARFVVSIGALR